MTILRAVSQISPQSDLLAALPASVEVAGPGEPRCADRLGALRCVRRPHPRHPNAHVRVAGHREGAGAVRTIHRGQDHATYERLAG